MFYKEVLLILMLDHIQLMVMMGIIFMLLKLNIIFQENQANMIQYHHVNLDLIIQIIHLH